VTASEPDLSRSLGVVVIGRDEGERLKAGIKAIPPALPLVYVDSASKDGSPDFTQGAGIATIILEQPPQLTAARARNAGLDHLARLHLDLQFVQMVDGDCELAGDWLDHATAALRAEPRLGAVFGELRESRPEASLYNRIAEVEWSGPPGEVASCGGIAMYRVAAFSAVGGFDPTLLAGEEPDLCLRLRRSGWTIRRLPALMGHHDADLRSFGQWWHRAARGGLAYAALDQRHGSRGDPGWRRQIASSLIWGAAIPALLTGSLLLLFVRASSGLLLLATVSVLIAVQIFRIRRKIYPSWPSVDGVLASSLMMLAKVAQTKGIWRYWRRQSRVPLTKTWPAEEEPKTVTNSER
jgi:GT2 family glycosyltransferase